MSKCMYCEKNIDMDIEFGNSELKAQGLGGEDGFTCSKECDMNYHKKVDNELLKISKMSNSEFNDYMHMRGKNI